MLLVPPHLTRYSGPDRRTAIRGLILRALVPGLVLWLAIAGFGELLTGPLKGWNRSESDLNRSLQDIRDRAWDSITAIWSEVGNTEIIIGVCAVAVVVVWWRTRRWWFAVIPAIAITLQASIFVAAAAVIGRPRPDVPHLDPAPAPLQLSPRPCPRERRALCVVGHHGHDHRADLAAPDRDCRVLGHPVPRGLRAPVPRHAPSQRRRRRSRQRPDLRRSGRALPGPPSPRHNRGNRLGRHWRRTCPKTPRKHIGGTEATYAG